MGAKWVHYKKEHVFYYNEPSIRFLLDKYGFDVLELRTNMKIFSLRYISDYLKKYDLPVLSGLLRLLFSLLPHILLDFPFKTSITGEMRVIARRKE